MPSPSSPAPPSPPCSPRLLAPALRLVAAESLDDWPTADVLRLDVPDSPLEKVAQRWARELDESLNEERGPTALPGGQGGDCFFGGGGGRPFGASTQGGSIFGAGASSGGGQGGDASPLP